MGFTYTHLSTKENGIGRYEFIQVSREFIIMNWNTATLRILSVLFVIFSINAYSYEAEIDKLSMEMTDKIASVGKKKVAVVDFTDLEGQVTLLGRFFGRRIFCCTCQLR